MFILSKSFDLLLYDIIPERRLKICFVAQKTQETQKENIFILAATMNVSTTRTKRAERTTTPPLRAPLLDKEGN